MISDTMSLRPRYGEVDQMGYVYHANYVSYCHQARTELFGKYCINDRVLEENNIMIPVISFEIKYLKPAYYDELLMIKTRISEMPEVKCNFEFEITNMKMEKLCIANSTIVFVNAKTRKPIRVPKLIEEALKNHFETMCQ